MITKGLSYFQTCSTHTVAVTKKVKKDNSLFYDRPLLCYYTTYNKCTSLAYSVIHLNNY